MIRWLIYGLIFLGSALMVFNIIGFVQYARFVRGRAKWNRGSGMGLAVTKQEAELMHGKIEVSSEQGVGSEFRITVPFHYSEESVEELEFSLEGCRILIVEDVDENAELVADLLELEGAVSEHAENGVIALSLMEHSAPGYYDAILMDLRMPVMDGLDAARSIRAMERKDAKTIPIIALTANAFEIDVQNSREAGMNEHLVKPIDSELLYAVLKKLIRKTRAERGTDS